MRELRQEFLRRAQARGVPAATADEVFSWMEGFSVYGYSAAHAASFALIAYASAFLKVKYLAAFTCAILNNQPMGFYAPAVLVKDAQRHGLRIKPIDIQISEWACAIEHDRDNTLSVRLGLRYAKGLRKQSADLSYLQAFARILENA